jgi:hypothetical protein
VRQNGEENGANRIKKKKGKNPVESAVDGLTLIGLEGGVGGHGATHIVSSPSF